MLCSTTVTVTMIITQHEDVEVKNARSDMEEKLTHIVLRGSKTLTEHGKLTCTSTLAYRARTLSMAMAVREAVVALKHPEFITEVLRDILTPFLRSPGIHCGRDQLGAERCELSQGMDQPVGRKLTIR